MKRTSSVVVVLSTLLWNAAASAAPADVFFVLDTSASMNAPGADGTQLDDAKAIMRRLAEAAEAAGHRASLLRFRQATAVVMGGEGLREVAVEDPNQCERAADVLVPMSSDAASAIAMWVDGVEGQGLREVEALGDSPLYGATRAALRYADGLRTLEPRRHCVRALIVLVTDGEDNCAGGAELLAAVDELEAAGPEDAIQTLVIARHVDAEAAGRLARVGREEDTPRVFGFEDVEEAAERIASLQGSAVIPSCTPGAEVPQPTLDAGADAERPDAGTICETGATTGGCSAAGSTSGAFLFLLGWVLLRRRRDVGGFVLLATLIACGDDSAACPDSGPLDVGTDTSIDGSIEPVEPEDEATRLRLRQAEMRTLLESALTDVTALVEPTRLFEDHRAPGETPYDACQSLVDEIAFEPYVGFQRGVRGCLATRRCNAADQTLVLQACLAHHGVDTELRACRFDGALDEARDRLAAQRPTMPDVSEIDATLRAGARSGLDDLPELQRAIEMGVASVSEYAMQKLTERVDEDVARLAPLVAHDAEDSASRIAAEEEQGWNEHYFLVDASSGEETRLDALLESPTDCFDASVDLATAPQVRISLAVQNVRLSGTYFQYLNPVTLGEIERPLIERYGAPLAVAVTSASTTAMPESLPAPSGEPGAPCFRAFLDGEPTASFPLFASDISACGDDVPEDLQSDHGFGRLILRTEIDDPATRSVRVRERTLVDRFGYARNIADAVANGPVFGADAARHLLPMRVLLDVGAGIPGAHEELYATLVDELARFDERAGKAIERIGAGSAPGYVALPDYGTRTFGLARAGMGPVLGEGVRVRGHRAWRLARIWRRVFVPGDGIVEKRIFDLLDVAFSVHEPSGDPPARLQAALRWGALLTEAERFAGMALDGSLRVVHAGDLLRDATVPYEEYDAVSAVNRFPLGLRDAASERSRAGDEIFITSDPADVYGTEVLSWWRVDDLGVPTGEIRYEGTLYGGVTAAKAVATFVRCLGFQAIIGLTGPRVEPDVSCCADLAFRQAVADMIVSWIMTGVTGGVGLAIGGTYGDAAGDVADAVGDGVTTAGDVDSLLNLWRDPPPCVRFIEDG